MRFFCFVICRSDEIDRGSNQKKSEDPIEHTPWNMRRRVCSQHRSRQCRNREYRPGLVIDPPHSRVRQRAGRCVEKNHGQRDSRYRIGRKVRIQEQEHRHEEKAPAGADKSPNSSNRKTDDKQTYRGGDHCQSIMKRCSSRSIRYVTCKSCRKLQQLNTNIRERSTTSAIPAVVIDSRRIQSSFSRPSNWKFQFRRLKFLKASTRVPCIPKCVSMDPARVQSAAWRSRRKWRRSRRR